MSRSGSAVAAAVMVAAAAVLALSSSGAVVGVAAAAPAPTLFVASWNIQTFGQSAAGDPAVMELIVRILRRYDVCAIQEIRDVAGTAFPQLMRQLNANVTGVKTYANVTGSRLGTTSSKEQYAFVYDTAKLEVVGAPYEYPTSRGQFERPPLAVQFRVLAGSGAGASASRFAPFALVNIHTKPTAAVAEIDALVDAYDAAVGQFGGNANAMIMGDYNAGCSYVSNSAWANIRLWTQPRFTWLIPNSADTMVTSDCPYDRFVVAGANLTAAVNASSAGVFNYEALWAVPNTLARAVSDHLPIQVHVVLPAPPATPDLPSSSSTGAGGLSSSSGSTSDAAPRFAAAVAGRLSAALAVGVASLLLVLL